MVSMAIVMHRYFKFTQNIQEGTTKKGVWYNRKSYILTRQPHSQDCGFCNTIHKNHTAKFVFPTPLLKCTISHFLIFSLLKNV
jgi:hypothetical protein